MQYIFVIILLKDIQHYQPEIKKQFNVQAMKIICAEDIIESKYISCAKRKKIPTQLLEKKNHKNTEL